MAIDMEIGSAEPSTGPQQMHTEEWNAVAMERQLPRTRSFKRTTEIKQLCSISGKTKNKKNKSENFR